MEFALLSTTLLSVVVETKNGKRRQDSSASSALFNKALLSRGREFNPFKLKGIDV